MMNREQATHLAEIIHTIRPAWDTRAITKALRDVADRDLADICHAAIRAAENPLIEKPIVIALDGEHWRPTIRTETPRSPTRTEICPKTGHTSWANNCAQCRADALVHPDVNPDPQVKA